jgi:hypothetical protein
VTQYVIRVGGWLSDDLLTAFPQLLATPQPVSTVLHGELPDQAALSSVLDFLDEMGVEIVEVTKLPPKPVPATILANEAR